MKRVICALLAASIVCGLAWLWGFDFNERGDTAIVVAYLALAASGVVYFFPGWKG